MTDASPDSLQPVQKAITIFINGEPVRRNAPSDLALIDLLHEDLGLTGAKFGCGIGVCRACTVLARRTQASLAEPLLACSTPAVALDGYWLETIEGVAGSDGLSPVQTSFLNHFAFQCGYCTPGFVMATLILLERLRAAPVPPEGLNAAIEEALGGHICRCTGYARYHAAIRDLIANETGLVR